MEFLNKYELLEPVTNGPIDVMIARELSTGLRRLVHLLECKEDCQSRTKEQLLQVFRRFAPDPPGAILDIGQFANASHLYLITTFPADPLALQSWVESYEKLRSQRNAEESASTAGPPNHSPPVLVSMPGPAMLGGPKSRPGSAASLSNDLAQPNVSAGKPTQAPHTQMAQDGRLTSSVDDDRKGPVGFLGRTETGAFTKEFMRVLDGCEREAPSGMPSETDSREPGTFTREFGSLSGPAIAGPSDQQSAINRSLANEPMTPEYGSPLSLFDSSKDEMGGGGGTAGFPSQIGIMDSKTGEFTKFFRSIPEVSPKEVDTPARGETPIPNFGAFVRPIDFRGKSSPASLEKGSPEPRFSDGRKEEAGQAPKSHKSVEMPDFSGGQEHAPGPAGVVNMPRPSAPLDSEVHPDSRRFSLPRRTSDNRAVAFDAISEPDWDAGEKPEAATRVFQSPVGSRSTPPPGDATPSEYTRIISRQQSPPVVSMPEPAAASGEANSQKVSLPMMSPAHFQVPQPLSVPPTPPPLAPPPVLSAPKPVSPPALPSQPKPVSYLSLIIVVNGVIVLAVALVLFFALKGR